ncbi:MAG: HD domain-containing protein [Synergistes sp.]|nr:HD domain-containing protein [Synergistes sp.]
MYSEYKTRKWFDDYTDTFRIDGSLSPRQEQKRKHSLRVMRIACQIAEANEWNEENDMWLAHAVGLLHDVARFEQCRDYGTFSDAKSFDHGERGADILAARFDWSGIDERDKDKVLQAVRHHNKSEISSHTPLSVYRWCALVRDADKIDICCSAKARFKDGTIYEMLPDGCSGRGFTPEFVSGVRRSKKVLYEKIRTIDDCGLTILMWAFDLHFPVSLATMKNEGIFDFAANMIKGHGEDLLVDEIVREISTL